MKNERTDIQQQITDLMIEKLEKGGLAPWVCPWTKTGEQAIPYNWMTKNSYSGMNILILWMRAMECGFTRNAWLTFKQASELGGRVRKGEKAVQCIFFKPVEVKNKDAKDGEEETRKYLCMKTFSVFNLDQVEGLENLPSEPVQREYDEKEAVTAIEALASTYCANTGLQVRFGGDRAYYAPALDLIRLPTTFHSGNGYAATYAHELVHSTGHRNRLNRFEETARSMKIPKESYAAEELVAELGSAFICAALGIEGQHEQHASYLDSWLRVLKGDKTFLFKAAAQAGKAFQLLMNGGIAVSKAEGEAA